MSRLLRGRQAARTERSTNGIVCALTADAKRRGDELPALEQFFSAISWVAVGEDVARAAGELARRYRRAHGGIDNADYLIAATALLLGADLLTTNVRHFPMLPGLQPPY